MSALREILDRMYVEEELLAQLDEEQKHVLFCKMREEQLRRWRLREAELEDRERNEAPKERDSRRIQWLHGRDGNVWVWVMGDHPADRSIDDILATETRQKARQLAEAELLLEKLGDTLASEEPIDEEDLKQQLRRMRLGTSSEESAESSRLSPRHDDGRPQRAESYDPKSVARFVNSGVPYYAQTTSAAEAPQAAENGGSVRSSFESNGRNSFEEPDAPAALESPKKSSVRQLIERAIRPSSGGGENSRPSPLPWRNKLNSRSESPNRNVEKERPPAPKEKRPSGDSNQNDRRSQFNESNGKVAHLVKSYDQPARGSNEHDSRANGFVPPGLRRTENSQRRSTSSGPPPPVPARPPHLMRKADNKELVQNTRSYVPGFPPKNEPQRASPQPFPIEQPPPDVRMRRPQDRPKELREEELDKRESRILEKLMEEHHRLKEEAEQEAERQRLEFEEQEKKAREAEAQIRFIAQRAREQHRNSLRTSTALLPVLENKTSRTFSDAVKTIQRPPKPANRQAIIRWFREVELPIGTGLDYHTREPLIWFHGILSRRATDSLLANQPAGAFLVRISERIWGYTVSYAAGGDEVKHFLVEKIDEGYQFMGTNQVVHESLEALVQFHESKPITSKGRELLFLLVQLLWMTPEELDAQKAAQMRFPHVFRGVVVHGFGRGGKKLKCPTANMDKNVVDGLPDSFADGVYAGLARVESGSFFPMAMSVGYNVHFDNKVKTVEVHILKTFAEDFYGAQLEGVVVHYIRPMRAYSSLSELMEAIERDKNETLAHLRANEAKLRDLVRDLGGQLEL
ncbi:SH2 domain-containing protein [Aphelenchoides fujianensis]|nr:SH2 domain-containing protein [Aphelenchoides fujianensis]